MACITLLLQELDVCVSVGGAFRLKSGKNLKKRYQNSSQENPSGHELLQLMYKIFYSDLRLQCWLFG